MKKQKKSPWKALVFALVMGGMGAVCGYYGIIFLKSILPMQAFHSNGTGETILFISLAFFAFWVVIAFHELGHLCAGILQGFRVALYVAGFLGVRATSDGVRFFFNKRINLMGGLAATFPERLESGPSLRRKFVRIVAAGPLSSLFLSIAALITLYFIVQNPGATPSLSTRSAAIFLATTGLTSTLIFLATMIPMRTDGFMSDGARLLSLLDNGEKGRYEEATFSVMVLIGAGKLPGEYPADLLEMLAKRAPDSILGLNGHFLNFTHYLDRGETKQAQVFANTIEEHIAAFPAAFQGYYLKEVVFFYAFLVRDAAEAQSRWVEIQKQSEREPDAATFRVKAALALLEGNMEAAEGFVQKGLSKIPDLPFEGQRKFEEKWLWAIFKVVMGHRQASDVDNQIYN